MKLFEAKIPNRLTVDMDVKSLSKDNQDFFNKIYKKYMLNKQQLEDVFDAIKNYDNGSFEKKFGDSDKEVTLKLLSNITSVKVENIEKLLESKLSEAKDTKDGKIKIGSTVEVKTFSGSKTVGKITDEIGGTGERFKVKFDGGGSANYNLSEMKLLEAANSAEDVGSKIINASNANDKKFNELILSHSKGKISNEEFGVQMMKLYPSLGIK